MTTDFGPLIFTFLFVAVVLFGALGYGRITRYLASSFPNVTPLAWLLGISCIANVITAMAAVYVLVGAPKVYVKDGYINATVNSDLRIEDRKPVRVEIVK